MLKSATLGILLIATAILPPTGSADHCLWWQAPVQVTVEAGDATYYFWARNLPLDGSDFETLPDLYVFEESNGLPGLQYREDAKSIDYTCRGAHPEDTLIFRF